MENTLQKTRGIIEGLSDFWLVYFKDIDQLRALYTGMDILVGQSYLDLLSLLLNNSTQDAPLFNKEYYKLVQIKETDIRYSQRENSSRNRYVYTPPESIVSIQALQNKVLEVSALLDKDADFVVTEDRNIEFRRDPLNAYRMRVFGTQRSQFIVRNRLPQYDDFEIWLNDTGAHPPTVTIQADGQQIQIAYDGPQHSRRGTARVLVSLINTHPRLSEVLRAELVAEDAGETPPAAPPGAVSLLRQAVSPLEGYGVRQLLQRFGGKFTVRSVPDWVALGVEKGDILRLISGASIGTPHEYPISLVRTDALYIAPGTDSLTIKAGDRIYFSILREPENNRIYQEPLAPTAIAVQSSTDGQLDPEARTLHSFSANFSPLHKDDIIEIQGIRNRGQIRILEVIDQTTVALATTLIEEPAAVQWTLHSTIPANKLCTNGTLHPHTAKTARFVGVGADFTVQAAGTAIKMLRGNQVVAYRVLQYLSLAEVILDGVVVESSEPVATWGWASYIPLSTRLAFPQIKKGTTAVLARRLWDHGVVVEGEDYLVNEDQGQIQQLTTWRADLEPSAAYDYRLVLAGGEQFLLAGNMGVLLSSSPARFRDNYASFNYSHLDQSLYIQSVGIFTIKAVHSAHEVEVYEDPRLVDKAGPNTQYVWLLYPRGTLQTENVETFVHEISFWATNALVDNYNLYHAFGYLIDRFEPSSEAYRALIRGVFQLFMLGPTLERLESAVNTVSGLSVIRDDGEILLDYISGAERSGADGYLHSALQQFVAETAQFTDTALASYVYIKDGLNENKLFKIVGVLSASSVLLETPVTDDGPVSWELVRTPEQQVVTSKRTYKFPKTIPLRATVTNPDNVGVKLFRAFEVLTEVFNVTDYIESPLWWENIQIPVELWEGEPADRRQASPQLVEHVIDPIDGAKIGDPGFLIGADHTGFSPDATTGAVPMRYNVAFVVLDTWLKHHLFYVSFNPVLMGSLSASLIRDLENLVFVAKPAYTYIILSPASLLKDLIPLEEKLEFRSKRWFGGQRGDEISINTQAPLLIDGTWRIGDWYRTYETEGTLNPPFTSTKYPLWTPAPGENARVFFSKVVLPNLPVPRLIRIFRPIGSSDVGAVVDNYLVCEDGGFLDTHVFLNIRIQGATVYTIGQVVDATRVHLGVEHLADEENVSWELGAVGSGQGLLEPLTFPYANFTDLNARHAFEASDVGTLIRFIESQESDNQVVEIVQVFPLAPYTCVVRVSGTPVQIQGPWEHLQEVVKVEDDGIRFNLTGVTPPSGPITFRAYGLREPINTNTSDYSVADGDLFYAIGMDHPRKSLSRLRSSLDVAIQDDPIRIIRRPVA